MADRELVIKIPEDSYKATCNGCMLPPDVENVVQGIKKGTLLPKGHGDLIDKDRLLDELEKTVESVDDTNKHLLFWDRAVAHVHLSKPIIEADKAESEDKE